MTDLYAAPPSVEECAPPTTIAMAGQNVTLLCLSSGVPTPVWVWSRGGRRLETGGRVTLLDRGERLHISGVREEDDGMYVCNVSNTIAIKNQTRSDSYTQSLLIQSEFSSVNNFFRLYLIPPHHCACATPTS